MAGSLEDLAARLADDVISAQDATGHDRLFMEVAQALGAASQTMEEAFLTEVRVRLAERTGRAFLEKRLKELRGGEGAAS